MKLLGPGILSLALSLAASALGATEMQRFYFDFGPNDVANRGENTPTDKADINGNYWNNINSTNGNNVTANSSFAPVRNHAGSEISGMSVTVNGQFVTNGMSGGGGLLSPSAELLGDLAIATATEDYMFLDGNNVDNRAFTITGLNPEHAYTFAIFTSRKASDERIGRFTIEGYNSFAGENQAAGSGIGANGENQNTSNILTSEPVFPTAAGTIKITVSRVKGAYIPINCMKMTEEEGVTRPGIETADRRFYFDFGATPQGANKCELTESPDANGNYWNNITNTSDGSKYAAAGTVFDAITDSKGSTSALTVTLNDRFSTNGMSGGGGLLAPSADLLGDLAIATATSDYYFYEADQKDCSFTIGGLSGDKAYKFYLFASRSASDNRTGNYRFSGFNLWSGTLQAAGSNLGGTGVNQNNSTILVSDYLFPDEDGNIKLTIMRESGTYIPLNCMKIEEYSGIERPAVNNYVSLFLSGTAAEGRKVVLSNEVVEGVSTNVFNGVADFAEGEFTLTAIDENGTTHVFGMAENAGKLVAGGKAIAVGAFPTIIAVDLGAMSYTLTPIENIRLIGSAVGSWSLDDYKEMSYAGNLVFTWTGDLEGHDTSTDSGRIGLYINGSWTAFKRDHIDADYNAVLTLGNGADIPINPGCYKMSFDLADGVFKVENGKDALDANRITVFGSSVANGQGADQIANINQGYMHLYGQHLGERNTSGLSDNAFYISNISIGGNSTVNLLNRYDDMRREFGKYVVFGVSLGNEGIHGAADQAAVYNQFKTNLRKLIDMVQADGKVPVVCNNYTRGDFTAEDYKYIIDMDREIGLWDVPSINLLGAIDSKSGKWAEGYQNGDDIYHPNQAGHEEFFYAMVPSMFDALQSGKTLHTERVNASGTSLKDTRIKAKPEGTMHSFSLVANIGGEKFAGEIANVVLSDNSTLTLATSDSKIFATLGDRTVTVSGNVTAENTLVALCYTYSSRILDLYVYTGATLLGSARMENVGIVPTEFTFGPSDIILSEAMLYRSALSVADVESLAAGELQKSSLEIYSAFGDSKDAENLAMSTNAFEIIEETPSAIADVIIENAKARYFTIEGYEVAQPAPGNIYIVLEDGQARKIIM